MFQTKVNQFLAKGVEGEYADDSPHREQPYVLLAQTTEGTAATGSLAFTANPADGDTVTIGSVVYRFKTTLEQANDIKIGSAATDTVLSLEKAVNDDGEEGTDYFAGTSPVDTVTAAASSSTLNLTAKEAGVAGNSIALASSDGNVTPTAFAGGTDSTSILPQFGYAFTNGAEDGTAIIGGEGVFAGVLTNPKMYANYANLKPSMTLPNGSQGGLCTFGHLFVKSAAKFAIGNIAAYDKTTGAISAYVNSEAVPANAVVIPNSRFIKYSGDAGTVAVLELGN